MPTFAYSGRTRTGQSVRGERIADTMDAAMKHIEKFRLEPIGQRITCSFLIVHGKDDQQISIEDARKMFNVIASKDKVGLIAKLFGGGSARGRSRRQGNGHPLRRANCARHPTPARCSLRQLCRRVAPRDEARAQRWRRLKPRFCTLSTIGKIPLTPQNCPR
jgi:hypothetical protein